MGSTNKKGQKFPTIYLLNIYKAFKDWDFLYIINIFKTKQSGRIYYLKYFAGGRNLTEPIQANTVRTMSRVCGKKSRRTKVV